MLSENLQKLYFIDVTELKSYNISNVTDIFSIDPIGCKDIDDALSYDHIKKKIGIHIADVNYTLANLNIKYNKYSTIYAPHKTINMLPDELAYDNCSLLAGYVRPVISCWIEIETGKYTFKREFIRVQKNYCYDEVSDELIKSNNAINEIYEFSKIINEKSNYVESVKSSHEMVEVYMIFLNNKIATVLQNDSIIFRNQEPCEFAKYSYDNKGHSHMKLTHYTHFTSPIRRIVDQYIHQVLIAKLFDPNIKIIKPDVDKINTFEVELKKVNLLFILLYEVVIYTELKVFKFRNIS
jgi:exoribonuclease R